jgi:hypothetical protein
MYDMYPWDGRSVPDTSPAGPRPATEAVQIALDRRDNGGDAAGAVATAHRPTAGPTRQ